MLGTFVNVLVNAIPAIIEVCACLCACLPVSQCTTACAPCTALRPLHVVHVRALHVCRARAQGGLINMGFRKYASAVDKFASVLDSQWHTTNTILVAMPFICFILMCALMCA